MLGLFDKWKRILVALKILLLLPCSAATHTTQGFLAPALSARMALRRASQCAPRSGRCYACFRPSTTLAWWRQHNIHFKTRTLSAGMPTPNNNWFSKLRWNKLNCPLYYYWEPPWKTSKTRETFQRWIMNACCCFLLQQIYPTCVS